MTALERRILAALTTDHHTALALLKQRLNARDLEREQRTVPATNDTEGR